MSETEFMWKPAVAKLLQQNADVELSVDEILTRLFADYPNYWRRKRARYTKKYTDVEFFRKERGILTAAFTHKNRKIIRQNYPNIKLITDDNATRTLKAMVWRESDLCKSRLSQGQNITMTNDGSAITISSIDNEVRDTDVDCDSDKTTVANAEIMTKLNQMQHTLAYVLKGNNTLNLWASKIAQLHRSLRTNQTIIAVTGWLIAIVLLFLLTMSY